MNGKVDEFGRALVPIRLRAATTSKPIELQVWIDTGFTGELVLPQRRIEQLGLSESALVSAGLGDGTERVLHAYSCMVEWFGSQRQIEVIASQGTYPLLGVGLLVGHRLKIDYEALELTIE